MSPTKKIAVLSDFPLHAVPGFEGTRPAGHYATWLPQLAQAFAHERDFEFHWLILDSAFSCESTRQAGEIYFHLLPSWKRGRAATLFWADRYRIRDKLREIQPDLVHGWGTENIWGWATLEFPGPQLFSVQGLLGFYGKLGKQGLRDRGMALIEQRVLRKVQTITTESSWARERIEEQTGRKDIHLVEYGVAERFFEVEPNPDLKNPYSVMVGTADYRKGIDLAVEFFARPGLRDFSLKVVGGVSPFGELCKKRSSENVEWLGRKSQTQIIDLLAGARCLILPSRADVCANVVKEARVMGLPVVGSPNGGHTQYIQHGQNGFICPLESAESWEEALRLIFLNPKSAFAMGQYMRKEHRKILRPEKTAEGFLEIYRKMLCRSGSQGSA